MPRASGRGRQLEALEITAVEKVRVRILPGGRLDRRNAALYLDRSPKTLAQWAMQRRGPPPHKDNVSGRVFYYLTDLDACIAAEGAGDD